MLIAREKRKNNIVEYLLYMYQIEDIIRSFNLNFEMIDRSIIAQFEQEEEVLQEIRNWYLDLIQKMQEQELLKTGHLQQLKDLVRELQQFHNSLLTTYQDKPYQQLYDRARPVLIELVKRSGGKGLENEIDVALNGVYGLLVLRLKQQTISKETEEAMGKVSRMLAQLASYYKKVQAGELKLTALQSN
jgi:hypothetical protein